MAAQLKRRVTIENNLLSTMAANATFIKEFQFLTRLRDFKVSKKKPGCGGCSANTRQDAQIYNAAKQAIANMSKEKKEKLLKMLNATQISVTFMNGNRSQESLIGR